MYTDRLAGLSITKRSWERLKITTTKTNTHRAENKMTPLNKADKGENGLHESLKSPASTGSCSALTRSPCGLLIWEAHWSDVEGTWWRSGLSTVWQWEMTPILQHTRHHPKSFANVNSILMSTIWSRGCWGSHFTDEETEAQGSWLTQGGIWTYPDQRVYTQNPYTTLEKWDKPTNTRLTEMMSYIHARGGK